MIPSGRPDIHGRWPLVGGAILPAAWGAVAVGRGRLGRGDAWIPALGLPILLSHQTEEWVRPGGFLPFCNERLLGSQRGTWPLTERDGFHVNVTAGWSSAVVAATLWERSAAPAAFVLWIEAGNALMHSSMALRERRYNPGLATAVLLMGTHAAAGAVALRRSERLSPRGRRFAALAGVAFSAGMPIAMKLRMRSAS